MQVSGVLLDTMSIQRYIFSTNRLKENLGASYLVEDIYDSQLKEALKELFSIDDGFLKKWENQPHNMLIINNSSPVEIAYIGGGNAMLLFKDQDTAKAFVKKWTARILVTAPGIIPAAAIGEFDIEGATDTKFKHARDALFKKLRENKNKCIPQTVVPSHGISAECSHTGYSMQIWCDKLPKDEQNYISSVSNAKITAAEGAKKRLERLLEEIDLSSQYTFTDQLDKLGQQRGEESHIAIVHIDGNNMGDRFKQQETLKGLRELSRTVKQATENAFKELIKDITRHFHALENGFRISHEHGRKILPIRPIIIGGDDITFVCDARLGVYLAKLFIEKFQNKKVSDNNHLSACAGVAITKTKYPFYQGYWLAEDLLKSAKDARAKDKDNGSWIDFQLVYGRLSGGINDIRKKYYETSQGKLYMRPYKITDLDEWLKGVRELKTKKKWKRKIPSFKDYGTERGIV